MIGSPATPQPMSTRGFIFSSELFCLPVNWTIRTILMAEEKQIVKPANTPATIGRYTRFRLDVGVGEQASESSLNRLAGCLALRREAFSFNLH